MKKEKYKPIILRPEPRKKVPHGQNPDDNIFFRHMANAGDLIYSLPAIRQAVRNTGKKAVVYQLLNKPCKYWGADHPIGDIMFNEYMLGICAPLVEAQDYIERIEVWDCHRWDYNIDLIREPEVCKALGMPHGDIRQWVMMYYPELQSSIGEPWLELERPVQKSNDLIIVNRTARYNNQSIKYGLLNDLENPIGFIGVKDEFEQFQKWVPKAEYVKTKDLMEAARLISAAKVFIGNQSVCFAVAEGLGADRILEVCPEAPNVIPATPNGYLFRDQKGFEELVKLRLNA